MSLPLSQPEPVSSWKQEVNRRIAAHKNRQNSSTVAPSAPVQSRTGVSSRAAQAAARVAARYAQAPSYRQMQAAEAHAVLREAEMAMQEIQQPESATPVVAVEPGAAVSVSLPPQEAEVPEVMAEAEGSEELAAESVAEPAMEPAMELEQSPVLPVQQSVEVESAPAAPARQPAPEADMMLYPPVYTPAAPAPPAAVNFASSVTARRAWPEIKEAPWESGTIEPVEPDTPLHANLIEFPHELVATRKIRPRRAEGPFAGMEAEPPLSIYEVEPGGVATEPEHGMPAVPSTSVWSRPEWSDIELEAQPQAAEEPGRVSPLQPELYLAPGSQRLLAALVDGALITGAYLVVALMLLKSMSHFPAVKVMEAGGISLFVLVALIYQALFLLLDESTPGMKYASLSLCTFDGQVPTRTQLFNRLGALLLSVLPVGLGIAWVFFDDNHLSWHDQLSKTYLRGC